MLLRWEIVFKIISVDFDWNRVLFTCPQSQVNEFAAFAAKWSVFIIR